MNKIGRYQTRKYVPGFYFYGKIFWLRVSALGVQTHYRRSAYYIKTPPKVYPLCYRNLYIKYFQSTPKSLLQPPPAAPAEPNAQPHPQASPP